MVNFINLFVQFFLLVMVYFAIFDRFNYTYFYIINIILLAVWFIIPRLLQKSTRLSISTTYAIIGWGIATMLTFDLDADRYGFFLPLTIFIIVFIMTCLLRPSTISAYLFMTGLPVALIIFLFKVDGVLMYKYLVAFSTEGVRETVNDFWIYWSVLFILEIILVFYKIVKCGPNSTERTVIENKFYNLQYKIDNWTAWMRN